MARLMADVGPAPLPHLGERLTGHVILVTGATGMAAAAAERMADERAAEDIAAAAAHVLSDESRYLTGQLLIVDGGWSITDADPGDPP